MDGFQLQYFFLIIYIFIGFIFIRSRIVKNKVIAILVYVFPGLVITSFIFPFIESLINIIGKYMLV